MLALSVRNRMTGLLALFSLLLAAASLTLTYLTPGTERRTFFDMAYLGLELLAVATPILASTSLQILEFDQRTSWLVLARPVTRSGYAWGRFWGIVGAAWINIVLAAMVIALLVLPMGGLPEPFFLSVLVSALLEAVVIGALACLATFITTSYVTAMVVASGVVLLGYLSPTLMFLATKAGNPAMALAIRGVYWLLPHLSGYSVRDFAQPAESWYLAVLAGYALAYSGAVVLGAMAVFRRREV
jgi:ABC-type transport system involved in multi-copper enzyme maturation permease subunit